MNQAGQRKTSSGQPLAARWRVTREYWLLRSYREINDEIKCMVDEMRAFVEDFRNATPDTYWHRKSGLIVLAVVLVRIQGKLRTVRGINSELSLPSGSVCAERAAIAAALSQHLSLNRSDFVSIAVLAPNNANPIKPCGVCCEWIRKIEAASPTFSVVTFTSNSMEETLEYSSVTVSEELIDGVPDHLKGNWICRCGFELNLAQQVFCSNCKQSRFKFKTHLQNTRVCILQAIKKFDYPDDLSVPHCSQLKHTKHGTTLTPIQPSEEETEQDAPSAQSQLTGDTNKPNTRRRRRSTLYVANSFVADITAITRLPLDLVKKTIRDLLSLKFIAKLHDADHPQGSFIITSLGSDFLEASAKV